MWGILGVRNQFISMGKIYLTHKWRHHCTWKTRLGETIPFLDNMRLSVALEAETELLLWVHLHPACFKTRLLWGSHYTIIAKGSVITVITQRFRELHPLRWISVKQYMEIANEGCFPINPGPECNKQSWSMKRRRDAEWWVTLSQRWRCTRSSTLTHTHGGEPQAAWNNPTNFYLLT